jgi:hypothetical protein
MTIVHLDKNGNEKKTRVNFHGVFPRAYTGFNKPGDCVQLLRKLIAEQRT